MFYKRDIKLCDIYTMTQFIFFFVGCFDNSSCDGTSLQFHPQIQLLFSHRDQIQLWLRTRQLTGNIPYLEWRGMIEKITGCLHYNDFTLYIEP